MKTFAMQRIDEFKESEQASSLKMRDYKDSTDLILRGGVRHGCGKTAYAS